MNSQLRRGLTRLLEIKDSDVRILTLEQCGEAVDKGLHAGGAFSAVVPLVALHYGACMSFDVANPTTPGQDLFVLSKGHAVASLASIYYDLGYFGRSVLTNSRSHQSILNGHPGPVLPGVPIATGPMGQGLGVAQGFALAGQTNPTFDVFCVTGDGELQEGPIWESVMYAGSKGLDNLCVLVDHNHGQLDIVDRLIFPHHNLPQTFRSFGWDAAELDATHYDSLVTHLHRFKHEPRNGRPLALICRSTKGHGGFSEFMNKHKVVIPDKLLEQELTLQRQRREGRVADFLKFYGQATDDLQQELKALARRMHLELQLKGQTRAVVANPGPVLTSRAAPRDKRIEYDPTGLPDIDGRDSYGASDIVRDAMKVFARDPRVVSVDADLASTSGLEAGVGSVDQNRAYNVGVAEANMMLLGEAFAALGYNTWVSTFCPFYDWKVLRRIAVGYQERLEAMDDPQGWLAEGHGLDLTCLATAPNFETRTNGATHMGNDDITLFAELAHLKIIDCACPRQLLSIMRWIMEGNRGLVYLRVMRTQSAVIYHGDYTFAFGEGQVVRESGEVQATLISSGRGVHEILAAADVLARDDLGVRVVDMPSFDASLIDRLYREGKPMLFAEQNNGYLWSQCMKHLFRTHDTIEAQRLNAVNTLRPDGRCQFIHSATYEELLEHFALSPRRIVEAVGNVLSKTPL